MVKAGQGRCNNQLVGVLVNKVDDELTRLSYITEMKPSYLGAGVANPKVLLKKLRKEAKNYRLHGEAVKIKKAAAVLSLKQQMKLSIVKN